ncbi:unnamed protein product [Heligmosomoides polygyrus]|uniref:Uncharacterized protein n=1 Tax=Heligmosomoides polygyrus TaxID=6339 RepID=A0A183G2X6_HELPZ|nr:unnamed protein product [Heligmosomoides polygyrus]
MAALIIDAKELFNFSSVWRWRATARAFGGGAVAITAPDERRPRGGNGVSSARHVAKLQKELHHKQLQMSELADRIKQMGTDVQAHGNFNGVDLSRLEEWDGHLLLAVAHAKLRAEKGASASYVGHRAREKESFKRFINSFLVKYPKRLWDDKSLIQLLEGMLRKDALTIFGTLPHNVKAGTFDDVVRAMEDRLKVDDNNACVKAMTKLRKLAIRDRQSVSEFCLVSGKWPTKHSQTLRQNARRSRRRKSSLINLHIGKAVMSCPKH